MLQLPLNKIGIVIYFENLIVRLHVIYTFNTRQILFRQSDVFTLWFIKLFLCIILDYKNLQFKQLIDAIPINL